MESATSRKSNKLSTFWFLLHLSLFRGIFVQTIVGTILMVIGQIFCQYFSKVLLTEDNMMAQAVSANGTETPLNVAILPGTLLNIDVPYIISDYFSQPAITLLPPFPKKQYYCITIYGFCKWVNIPIFTLCMKKTAHRSL